MASVTFVDTSVLLELLRVPGKSQRPDEVRQELEDRVESGSLLVLPITSILETGNHIAQVPTGDARRKCAAAFVDLLRATVEERLPWVLHAVAWDERVLGKLCDGVNVPGGGETGGFVDVAGSGVLGAGDLMILAECELYADRTEGVQVGIWTHDERLAAYVS